jgi:hypothetical protein
MKQLPDILVSVSFWASIATLWSAAGAWFTYVGVVNDSRRKTHDGILNLIAGIEAELELISPWASGSEGEQGYLQSKSLAELILEHDDWANPGRLIFTFDTPTLSGFTNSRHMRDISQVVRPLVRLNHSIRRLLDYVSYQQKFVAGDPKMYQSVLKKTAPGANAVYTDEEIVYRSVLFEMNRKIHQEMIGGADSKDELCLYRAFRSARKALQEFKQNLKVDPLPWWYPVLHIAAAGLALLGGWQVLRWFDVCKAR